MARPSRLTPQAEAAIIQAIAGGNTRKTAAAYAGVTDTTLYRWLATKPEFRKSIEKAEADAIAASVALIRMAARTQWQAAAWWLERRYSEEWGQKAKVDVKVLIEREARRVIEAEGLSEDDLPKVISEVERILAANAG